MGEKAIPMAKALSIVAKSAAKMSNTDKLRVKAQKAFVQMVTTGGITSADVNTFADAVSEIRDVLNQTGTGAGKRFSGSASHEYADQCVALVDVTTNGNVAKIG